MESVTKFVIFIGLTVLISAAMAAVAFSYKSKDTSVGQRARTRRWGVALDTQQRLKGGRAWPPPSLKSYIRGL